MSASLVGSEMCIRDRDSRACAAGTGRCWTDARNMHLVRGGGAPAGKAVSYTHLTLPTICSV
eukprot:10807942-Alexandrium_andersonii.AAC.1